MNRIAQIGIAGGLAAGGLASGYLMGNARAGSEPTQIDDEALVQMQQMAQPQVEQVPVVMYNQAPPQGGALDYEAQLKERLKLERARQKNETERALIEAQRTMYGAG